MTDLEQQLDNLLTWDIDGVKEPVIFRPELKAALIALIEQRELAAVQQALKTERKATLGFSNDMKIDRALALAEKAGYEKCLADQQRSGGKDNG